LDELKVCKSYRFPRSLHEPELLVEAQRRQVIGGGANREVRKLVTAYDFSEKSLAYAHTLKFRGYYKRRDARGTVYSRRFHAASSHDRLS
jgi:hypothetical protein